MVSGRVLDVGKVVTVSPVGGTVDVVVAGTLVGVGAAAVVAVDGTSLEVVVLPQAATMSNPLMSIEYRAGLMVENDTVGSILRGGAWRRLSRCTRTPRLRRDGVFIRLEILQQANLLP